MKAPWLSVIGIGEDGVEGLSSLARQIIAQAESVIGGERHLKLAASLIRGTTEIWGTPFSDGVHRVLAMRGRPVTVLASGDPFFFGVGSTLAKHLEPGELFCVPAPSSISWACARLGWAQQDVRIISLCGRPIETLAPQLQPAARLIVLSADGSTPDTVCRFLADRGFGKSKVHVIEHLGGPDERTQSCLAEDGFSSVAALNLMGIEVEAHENARVIPLVSGLDDDLFEHDGQITKREIRAITLSTLAPKAGEVLWDVGAGAGSIAIEWMLRHPSNRAIAIEQNSDRVARIGRNALTLGVPGLQVVEGRAPDVLRSLERPDVVFIGGGLTSEDIFIQVREALRIGGRLVANAVTLEGEAILASQHAKYGGTLTRIGIERLDTVGRLHAFRPAMRVTQYATTVSGDGA
ncbi:precorrin-6y C5,15-methyltransferase (decarboxylating) subunit CbiE [Gluconobacter frateurii]|uniref:Cobalamin biosynthesis protein precorrin-6Y C5,15-methyltransferase n=1 Tax=Gluconobacter frateurii NRIC 0228 TaxID=1307946 RepID=A0ABQ0QF25_9PROT|nr:precorrin-6y C5,15-methyltransferase (decarboxylating) subunit CbiE [Gluconobacter frateurii]GBR16482.1 cobalamin biosynthesis protein precorrin-6Y C5,15-methyltransferase [Gluconobacter frateurii NRIC 0228]GLP90584.1 precorrin-6Y methyltransferase [Gluconobacter frateurii]